MQRWSWLKSLHVKHKYAINSRYLGDDRILAWSNLGYWDEHCTSYVQACQALADCLAQAVQLAPQDRLLDLGCGQGASLKHWQQHYQVSDLTAVELQAACIEKIQQQLKSCPTLYRMSFLQLHQLKLDQKFDVILCIDAAYHSPLNAFLSSVQTVLAQGGRLGFHYLALSEQFEHLNIRQQRYYRYLLKAADVDLSQLQTISALKQSLSSAGLEQIKIEDLSQPVFAGFAKYIQQLKLKKDQGKFNIDYFKISLTAQLCQQLYQKGMLRYVQISVQNSS